jgi:metallophosphoesterase superfamily enzyme
MEPEVSRRLHKNPSLIIIMSHLHPVYTITPNVVVNAPAYYSGDPWFRYQPGYSDWVFFVVSLRYSR